MFEQLQCPSVTVAIFTTSGTVLHCSHGQNPSGQWGWPYSTVPFLLILIYIFYFRGYLTTLYLYQTTQGRSGSGVMSIEEYGMKEGRKKRICIIFGVFPALRFETLQKTKNTDSDIQPNVLLYISNCSSNKPKAHTIK